MHSPVSINDRAVHPIVVFVPIFLWGFALVCDVIGALGGAQRLWGKLAFYSLGLGLLAALVTAVPGYFDFRSLKDAGVARKARTHMGLNVAGWLIFLFDFAMRTGNAAQTELPLLFSVAGVILITISGWLGIRLVHVDGVLNKQPAVVEPGDQAVLRDESRSRFRRPRFHKSATT